MTSRIHLEDRRQFIQFLGKTLFVGSVGPLLLSTLVNESAYTQTSILSGSENPKQPPSALLFDPFFRQHDTGNGHPENANRYDAIIEALTVSKLTDTAVHLHVREADDDMILMCHNGQYLDSVKRDIAEGKRRLSTGDTNISSHSLKAGRLAVGAVLEAIDAIMVGKVKNAFCVVRPPGHHATPDRGMGFCIFNNVAIAARYAQRAYGFSRVLIIDWDVHHGNGTQDIFYHDGSVFYFSTHQYPWYPGTGLANETGSGAGKGTTLNCPLPAGSGREEIIGAFLGKLLPAAKRFRPDLVLISAGFDSRINDPLGRFTLSDNDFIELTHIVLTIASEYSGGRVVSVLEGGYNLNGLAKAVAAHVKTLQSL